MKILLVEDDPVSLEYLAHQLRRLGHEVSACERGDEAWAHLLAGEYRLVVSDWKLPGLTGLELCRKIRAACLPEYVFFFLVTSAQADTALSEAMEAGVDDFLPKPVDPATLAIRLQVAVRILEFHGQVKTLQDLLPICMYCKKIRDDRQFWVNVESYFTTHAGADFTHSLCPDCHAEHIRPQFDALGGAPPSNS